MISSEMTQLMLDVDNSLIANARQASFAKEGDHGDSHFGKGGRRGIFQ